MTSPIKRATKVIQLQACFGILSFPLTSVVVKCYVIEWKN